jgi:hypothetical protein
MNTPNSFRTGPDLHGHFGAYGGRFVAETLMPLVLDLERAYEEAKNDPKFHAELNGLLTHYVGRPSALYFAERLPRPDLARAPHGQDAHHRGDGRRPARCGDRDGGRAFWPSLHRLYG